MKTSFELRIQQQQQQQQQQQLQHLLVFFEADQYGRNI